MAQQQQRKQQQDSSKQGKSTPSPRPESGGQATMDPTRRDQSMERERESGGSSQPRREQSDSGRSSAQQGSRSPQQGQEEPGRRERSELDEDSDDTSRG
jgi:hypothetical protein